MPDQSRKVEKTQINKVRNEKEVTTDNTEIQRIIRDYDKQLTMCQKMDNLEDMDKFLQKYNLTRLNQGEIENIKKQITSTEIETVIKNLPTNRSPGPEGFTGKFYQNVKEQLTARTLPENCRGRKTSKLILRGHHYFDTKIRQRYHQKKKIASQYH